MLRTITGRLGIFGTIFVGLLAALLLAQLVPYGHAHDNPRPTRSAQFATAKDQELFATACGDCHSDKTRWPWYSNVAPMSWLVQHDVEDGRGAFNVSEWDRRQPDAGEVVEQIEGGSMPPWQYKLVHGDARLSKSERAALASAMQRLYQHDPPAAVGGG